MTFRRRRAIQQRGMFGDAQIVERKVSPRRQKIETLAIEHHARAVADAGHGKYLLQRLVGRQFVGDAVARYRNFSQAQLPRTGDVSLVVKIRRPAHAQQHQVRDCQCFSFSVPHSPPLHSSELAAGFL